MARRENATLRNFMASLTALHLNVSISVGKKKKISNVLKQADNFQLINAKK